MRMRKPARPLPSLDLVRGFEAAARELSFTRAGAELHLTQSAVSRQIKALEDHLGVKLFTRMNRALKLTAEGEAFYRTAQSVMRQLADATAAIAQRDDGRLLTVTTTIVIFSLKLFDIVRVMTGGNNGTDVIANEFYLQRFTYGNAGRASAIAIVLLVAVIPVMIYNLRQFQERKAF